MRRRAPISTRPDTLCPYTTLFRSEPELGPGGGAADLLRAALAQVDLVEVGLEDRALVVARLDQQREQDLVELAGVSLLAADAQDARARQLLGQRAAALPCLARLQVDPDRKSTRLNSSH